MKQLYSTLLCNAIHPKRFTIMWGGGGVSPQPPPVYSILLDDATAATGQRHNALTTHQIQVERRESHRANQVYALTTHQIQVERRESHRANQVDEDY